MIRRDVLKLPLLTLPKLGKPLPPVLFVRLGMGHWKWQLRAKLPERERRLLVEAMAALDRPQSAGKRLTADEYRALSAWSIKWRAVDARLKRRGVVDLEGFSQSDAKKIRKKLKRTHLVLIKEED